MESLRRWFKSSPEALRQSSAPVAAPVVAADVPQALLNLFAQANSCTAAGNSEGNRNIVGEILARFANDLEVTAVGYEAKTIHLRPLKSRYIALAVVRIEELPETVQQIARTRIDLKTVDSSLLKPRD